MKLDLACGNARTSGFVGVDKYLPPDPNRLQFDLLEFPWRFPDESIEEVVCHHFIEHIPMTETPDGVDLLCAFMDEVWRILKTGGQATFFVASRSEHPGLPGPHSSPVHSVGNLRLL